jgi:hypothetical protein
MFASFYTNLNKFIKCFIYSFFVIFVNQFICMVYLTRLSVV